MDTFVGHCGKFPGSNSLYFHSTSHLYNAAFMAWAADVSTQILLDQPMKDPSLNPPIVQEGIKERMHILRDEVQTPCHLRKRCTHPALLNTQMKELAALM